MIQIQIKKIIAQQLGIVESTLSMDTDVIRDLNADSLDLIELVIALERNFGVKIEESEYEGAKTVQQIIELVQANLPKKS